MRATVGSEQQLEQHSGQISSCNLKLPHPGTSPAQVLYNSLFYHQSSVFLSVIKQGETSVKVHVELKLLLFWMEVMSSPRPPL